MVFVSVYHNGQASAQGTNEIGLIPAAALPAIDALTSLPGLGDNRLRSASSMETPSSRKASTATPIYRVFQRTIAFTTNPNAFN